MITNEGREGQTGAEKKETEREEAEERPITEAKRYFSSYYSF
jgi:hypothetical protein